MHQERFPTQVPDFDRGIGFAHEAPSLCIAIKVTAEMRRKDAEARALREQREQAELLQRWPAKAALSADNLRGPKPAPKVRFAPQTNPTIWKDCACGTRIRTKAKTCKPCFWASLRKGTVERRCVNCDVVLSTRRAGVQCRKCCNAGRVAPPVKCPGCGEALDHRNRSGMCRACKPLKKRLICPHCSAALGKNAKFAKACRVCRPSRPRSEGGLAGPKVELRRAA